MRLICSHELYATVIIGRLGGFDSGAARRFSFTYGMWEKKATDEYDVKLLGTRTHRYNNVSAYSGTGKMADGCVWIIPQVHLGDRVVYRLSFVVCFFSSIFTLVCLLGGNGDVWASCKHCVIDQVRLIKKRNMTNSGTVVMDNSPAVVCSAQHLRSNGIYE